MRFFFNNVRQHSDAPGCQHWQYNDAHEVELYVLPDNKHLKRVEKLLKVRKTSREEAKKLKFSFKLKDI